MSYFLQVTLNIVLILFAIGQTVVLMSIVAVCDRNNKHEIILRALTVVSGILIYVVARAVRLPFFGMIESSMSYLLGSYDVYLNILAMPLALLLTFVVAIALSSSVSGYIINHTQIEEAGDHTIGTRLMCLVLTLVLLLYCDLYLSFDVQGVENIDHLKPLLPDVVFILSTLWFVIFRLRPFKIPTISRTRSV